MKSLTGTTRIIFLCFFASHIPITLLIDSQALLSSFNIHPQALQDFVENYAIQMKDALMKRPFDQVWFKAVVAAEMVLQVPFFFWAVSQLANASPRAYTERFRTACLLYGSHTATTLIPILASIMTNPEASMLERIALAAVYLPYLMFPLWIVYLAAPTDEDEGKKKR